MFGKQKIAMLLAEFMGVVILATSVFSVIRWQLPSMFVAITAGLVLAVLVNTIGSTSGSHVNPAITLGLWSIRKITTLRAVMYVAVQLLGGLATLSLLAYLLGTKVESSVIGSFEWKIFIAEALGAFVFGFGVASAIAQKQANQMALTIGFSLTVGILIASLASNGIINPAVAVGLNSWSWAYAAGPVAGAIVGMNIHALLFTDTLSSGSKSLNIRSVLRSRISRFSIPTRTRVQVPKGKAKVKITKTVKVKTKAKKKPTSRRK